MWVPMWRSSSAVRCGSREMSLSVRSATAKMSANPVVAVSLLRSLRPTTATTGLVRRAVQPRRVAFPRIRAVEAADVDDVEFAVLAELGVPTADGDVIAEDVADGV